MEKDKVLETVTAEDNIWKPIEELVKFQE